MSTHVEIRLKLQDQASAGLKSVAKEAERLAQQSAVTTERVTNRSAAAYRNLNHARETLGVRSENAIQREIQRTEAAYNRLARSGQLSTAALSRAQDASTSKIKVLRRELNGAEKDYSRLKMLGSAALAVGAYSAANATKQAIEQSLSLDERLGLRANAAYRGKDFDTRRKGEGRMRAGIKTAIAGGMTVDESMDTLDELIAKNQVGGVDNAIALLPQVAKFKAGQGGSPVEAASLISTLMGSGFAKDQRQAMHQLDMIAAAGGAGAFETADLARHLPSLLGLAKTQGYVGDSGLKRVLVMLEQGMTTAGSADESANNLRNLLSKMNAGDTANDFKKMGRGDLANTMLKARANGKTPDEVYLEIIAEETRNNPKLRTAMKQAAMAKDEVEREERVKAVNELAKGQTIGKLFQDMQAKGAFLALLNEAFGKEVSAAIDKSSGTIDKDAAYIQTKTGYKKRVAGETVNMAKLDAVDKLSPIISKVADGFTDLALKHPLLAGAATLATGALVALAGVAGLSASSSLADKFLPKSASLGKGILNGGKALIGAVGSYVASGATALFSPVAGGILAAGAGGYALGTGLNYGINSGLSAFTGRETSLGSELFDWLNASSASKAPAKIDSKLTVGLAPGLVITSQSTMVDGPVKNIFETGNMWRIP